MAVNVPRTSTLVATSSSFTGRIFATVLAIDLFVAVLAGCSLYRSRQQLESHVAIQTQNLSQSLSLTIAGLLDTSSLALFAVEKEIHRQFQFGAFDRQATNQYILAYKNRIPELEGLRFANARGDVVCGDRVVPGSYVNIADRDYFLYARQHPELPVFLSRPMYGRNSKKWVFDVVRPVRKPDGSFAGIVFAAISLDYLARLFSTFDLGANGVLTLRDSSLTVIVRYPEPPGGKSSTGSRTVSQELMALTGAGRTAGRYRNKGSIDPVERTFCFNKINNYPLYVTVGRATRDYLTPWRNETVMLSLIVATFVLGSLASALVVCRNRRREELAETELIRFSENLEATVRLRTAELESKNDSLSGEISLRQQAEADLKKSAVIMGRLSDSVVWIAQGGEFLYVNDAACRLYGYGREELLSMAVSDVDPSFSRETWALQWEELKHATCLHFETENRNGDGHRFPVEITSNFQEIDGVEYNCAIIRDISERRDAEAEKGLLIEQLIQAQKMESIGRLAGGVAHDFNNLLTPIIGFSQLLKMQLAENDPAGPKLDNILKAAQGAKELVQQLLSFSRKQVMETKVIDLSRVIGAFQSILRHSIRENVDIRLSLSEEPYTILADANKIEQIVMNLAVNAQDAIDGHGVITIETAPVLLDDEYANNHSGVEPGHYLMLAVTDDGRGIDQQTRKRIFEPFFTTKGVGKGTGLGLATVYGIVQQHGGNVWVYSEPGKGTTFKCYFPIVSDARTGEVPEPEEQIVLAGARRTVLLVEDNEMVRNLVNDLLEKQDFQVLVAEDPRQALRISRKQVPDLLITDVVMPFMTGPELHAKLLERYPGLKVLYMSGYTSNVITEQSVLEGGNLHIQKPFAINEFTKRVHALLMS